MVLVTGSVGKTTIATLISRMLSIKEEFKAKLVGNIGLPTFTLASKKSSCLVVEDVYKRQPFGTIISSFFITFIIEGGGNLANTYYSLEIATLITSIIIYLCAFVLFIKTFITKRVNKKLEQTTKKEEK